MDVWIESNNKCDGNEAVRPGSKDIYVQLVISLALGLSAFIVFCVSSYRDFRIFAHNVSGARA
jgi:hypothetical protein